MKRRIYRKQELPFHVSVELVQGCTLACSFCGMAAIQEKPGRGFKFMASETLEIVARQLKEMNYKGRIGFAMRGEPSMHPDASGMITKVREILPKSHMLMLSNGSGFLRAPGPVTKVRQAFDAGLDILGFDHYEGVAFVPKVLASLENEGGKLRTGKDHKLGFKFYRYPEDIRGNPHAKHKPRGGKTLIQVRDIEAQSSQKKIGTHSNLNNHAGLGGPPDHSAAGKRCHLPFRRLVVHWDGNVPLCCNTWDSPYWIGNVHDTHLWDLWQSNAFGAAREKLIRGERDFAPCYGCNHKSYRPGLLPDLKGKGKLHRPDEQTEADIAEALSHGPHTPTVRIPWQKEEVA